LGERSPARGALGTTDWHVTARVLRGTWIDCPIALPPDLVVVEPAPLRAHEGIGPALAVHPVVARVPWLVVIDPERIHTAPRLACADFIVRGFAVAELIARAERLWTARPLRDTIIRSGPVVIDLQAHRAHLGELPLQLTPQEFALLRHLAANPARPHSREQLLHAVWGSGYSGGARTVDVHVRRLRVRLRHAAVHLETVREVGYCWSP